jgi:hypothetical protein
VFQNEEEKLLSFQHEPQGRLGGGGHSLRSIVQEDMKTHNIFYYASTNLLFFFLSFDNVLQIVRDSQHPN